LVGDFRFAVVSRIHLSPAAGGKKKTWGKCLCKIAFRPLPATPRCPKTARRKEETERVKREGQPTCARDKVFYRKRKRGKRRMGEGKGGSGMVSRSLRRKRPKREGGKKRREISPNGGPCREKGGLGPSLIYRGERQKGRRKKEKKKKEELKLRVCPLEKEGGTSFLPLAPWRKESEKKKIVALPMPFPGRTKKGGEESRTAFNRRRHARNKK